MAERKKLTQSQFDNAVEGLDIKVEYLAASYEHLVIPGDSLSKVAERYCIHRQRVYEASKRVLASHVEKLGLPDGWVEELVQLPTDEMAVVQKRSKKLKSESK